MQFAEIKGLILELVLSSAHDKWFCDMFIILPKKDFAVNLDSGFNGTRACGGRGHAAVL